MEAGKERDGMRQSLGFRGRGNERQGQHLGLQVSWASDVQRVFEPMSDLRLEDQEDFY